MNCLTKNFYLRNRINYFSIFLRRNYNKSIFVNTNQENQENDFYEGYVKEPPKQKNKLIENDSDSDVNKNQNNNYSIKGDNYDDSDDDDSPLCS